MFVAIGFYPLFLHSLFLCVCCFSRSHYVSFVSPITVVHLLVLIAACVRQSPAKCTLNFSAECNIGMV